LELDDEDSYGYRVRMFAKFGISEDRQQLIKQTHCDYDETRKQIASGLAFYIR